MIVSMWGLMLRGVRSQRMHYATVTLLHQNDVILTLLLRHVFIGVCIKYPHKRENSAHQTAISLDNTVHHAMTWFIENNVTNWHLSNKSAKVTLWILTFVSKTITLALVKTTYTCKITSVDMMYIHAPGGDVYISATESVVLMRDACSINSYDTWLFSALILFEIDDYSNMLFICHTWPKIWYFCFLYYCVVLWCAQIIEQLPYLEVLTLSNAFQIHYLDGVSANKSILSITFHAIYGAERIQLSQ